jgi:hypothetical protein
MNKESKKQYRKLAIKDQEHQLSHKAQTILKTKEVSHMSLDDTFRQVKPLPNLSLEGNSTVQINTMHICTCC